MRRAAALLLSLAPFAAACPSSGSVDGSVATSGHPSGGKSRTEVAVLVAISGVGQTVEAMVGVAARIEEKGGSRVPFVASPEASGGSSYEAGTMLAVRHGVHEGYERVVLDLGTGEEPTEAVPVWTLTSPKGDSLLRVTLLSITATGVSGGRFGDDLLKGFYVVRALEGGMFVDVFARRAFPYRVLELSDPAQPVVDFRPSGSPSRRRCEGWRQHGARGAARGCLDRPFPHCQRLLSRLRGVDHRRPGGLQGGGCGPADRREQRMGRDLEILRGDPGSTTLQQKRDPAGRGRKRPGRDLRRRQGTGPR
jgi:hypothetical protein